MDRRVLNHADFGKIRDTAGNAVAQSMRYPAQAEASMQLQAQLMQAQIRQQDMEMDAWRASQRQLLQRQRDVAVERRYRASSKNR